RAPLVVTAHTVREPGPARYAGGLGSTLANAVGAPAWHDVETFRRAALVIVHARLHRDRLVARGMAPERCRVIPPGVPPRAEVAVALEAMDVVVVPYATDESVSYSLHVALAQRRPIVATDVGPMREIQERGQCLLLVRGDDVLDLARALGTLVSDEAARRQLT